MRVKRRAFTLVEMVVILAVAGIVLTIAMPRFADAIATSNRLSGVRAAAAFLTQAKAVAIENGRRARVAQSGNVLTIELENDNGTWSVRAQRDFGAQYGVTLRSIPDNTIVFDSRGMVPVVSIIPPTIVVTRDGKSSRACVVGLAKVSVNRCDFIQ
ncbi:MAG: prepilin-type N-terminal cleavage/methylation domain-containing protein [Gemmatimonadaceae bacterium]|nr:prepilin-type N-terminal cleavage/methylation domain-containing protein [Gemmatimonadaceae bacterium]